MKEFDLKGHHDPVDVLLARIEHWVLKGVSRQRQGRRASAGVPDIHETDHYVKELCLCLLMITKDEILWRISAQLEQMQESEGVSAGTSEILEKTQEIISDRASVRSELFEIARDLPRVSVVNLRAPETRISRSMLQLIDPQIMLDEFILPFYRDPWGGQIRVAIARPETSADRIKTLLWENAGHTASVGLVLTTEEQILEVMTEYGLIEPESGESAKGDQP